MARLMPGESDKIDKINQYVHMARFGSPQEVKEGLNALLIAFKPLILKLCKKWSDHFRDEDHNLIPWDDIVADAKYWLIEYTLHKYDVDGPATYNNFIKSHLNQRIRYIYECQLNYNKKYLFPDPDKNNPDGDTDMLELVIQNYAKLHDGDIDIDEILINNEHQNDIRKLAHTILRLVHDPRYFTERERMIFMECIASGNDNKTHNDMGDKLGISRARVSQLIGRIRKKINQYLDEEVSEWWEILK